MAITDPRQLATISAFWDQNIYSSPQAILAAMEQYGVSTQDIANATGFPVGNIEFSLNKARSSPTNGSAVEQYFTNSTTPGTVQGGNLTLNNGTTANIANLESTGQSGALQLIGADPWQLNAAGTPVWSQERMFGGSGPFATGTGPTGQKAPSTPVAPGGGYQAPWGQTGSQGGYTGPGASSYPGQTGGQPGGILGGQGGAAGGQGGGMGDASGIGNPFASDGFKGLDLSTDYTPNPYLNDMAESIRHKVTDNLQRNILPGIDGGAVGSGAYGSSRQGVLQANAVKDTNQALSDALANLYGQDYNFGRNLSLQSNAQKLQQRGMDQNYALGMFNANNNFYTAQRGQDLQGVALGSDLFNQGTNDFMQQGQGIYALGLQQQQAPWNVQNWATNAMSPWSGINSSQISSMPNNMAGNALGGAMAGRNLWGGSSGWQPMNTGPTANSWGGSNSAGWGTGSGFGNQDYGSYF